MEKPYLNVVTNDTLADVYTQNASSLGIKFEGNMEKIKQVGYFNDTILWQKIPITDEPFISFSSGYAIILRLWQALTWVM